MKQITTWRPDTCKCVIHYEWDDAVPVEQRVHTPVEQAVKHDGTVVPRVVCPAHAGMNLGAGKKAEHFAAVQGENRMKNRALTRIMEGNPKLQETVIDQSTGEELVQFKRGHEPKWSFDANRNLIIDVDTKGVLTKGEKAAIESSLKEISGKVSIG